MRHFQEFQATCDIVTPPQMRQANGKNVASCQIGVIEERKNQQGQMERHMAKHTIEAWGQTANLLASIPVGNTVMVKGKVQNYKYKNQQGAEVWGNKVTVFTLGNCGPSQYGPPQQQQTQGGYQQQQPNYPPQNHAPQYPPQNSAPQYPPPNNAPPSYPPPPSAPQNQSLQNNAGGFGAAPQQQRPPNHAPGMGGYQGPPQFTDSGEVPF